MENAPKPKSAEDLQREKEERELDEEIAASEALEAEIAAPEAPKKQAMQAPQKSKMSLGSFTNFKPTLNTTSTTFVPSSAPKVEFSPTKQNPEESKAEGLKATPFNLSSAAFSLSAAVFIPTFAPSQGGGQKKNKGNKKKSNNAGGSGNAAASEPKTEAPKAEGDSLKAPKKQDGAAGNQKRYQVKGTAQAAAPEQPKPDAPESTKDAASKQVGAKQDKQGPQAHKIIARTGKTREEVKTDPKKGKQQKRPQEQGRAAGGKESVKEAPKKSSDPLKDYKPPFKAKEKPKNVDSEEKQKKVYTLEFIFSLKADNKKRPENMAELDFPSKKRGTNVNGFRKKVLTEKDKFNKMVQDIRILLNKLSKSNFDTISTKLLQFQYNPSLLYELMKMIFVKSTGEHSYLDVYVKLCTILFKEFNDRENQEMNFKKLLVTKCQKQFFKMLNKEREERKKRRESLDGTLPDNNDGDDDGLSKPMMYLMDDAEMEARKKQQMYGNMYLLTELFIAKQLNGNIIKTCLDDLQTEINDQNIEIICYMMTKLMSDLCRQSKNDTKTSYNTKTGKKVVKVINLDYTDVICQKLFTMRNDTALTSRTKFKIQDVIDVYNKEWRHDIADAKNKVSDKEGFTHVYIPKDQILSEEQVNPGKFHNKPESERKAGDKGYFYRPKSPAQTTELVNTLGEKTSEEKNAEAETKPKQNKMANLLSALKADDNDGYNKFVGADDSITDEDEDASRIVNRRVSMNKFNEVGMNFQKYNEIKPSQGVRREILNMFNEYKLLEKKEHSKEELISICAQYELKRFQFIGYFMANALAETPADFTSYISLVFDYFFTEQKLLDKDEMKESVNVCVANLPDLVIDYANAAKYAVELIIKAKTYGILSQDEEDKYKDHIKNLEEEDSY